MVLKYVVIMPPAMTRKVAMTVCATVATQGMDCPVQVSCQTAHKYRLTHGF